MTFDQGGCRTVDFGNVDKNRRAVDLGRESLKYRLRSRFVGGEQRSDSEPGLGRPEYAVADLPIANSADSATSRLAQPAGQEIIPSRAENRRVIGS